MSRLAWIVAGLVVMVLQVGCGKSALVLKPVEITVRVESAVKAANGNQWPVVDVALLGPPEAEVGKFKSSSPWNHFDKPDVAGAWERRFVFNFASPETGGTLQQTVAAADGLWGAWKQSGTRELIVLVRNNAKPVVPGQESKWMSVQSIEEGALKDVERLEVQVSADKVIVQPVKRPGR